LNLRTPNGSIGATATCSVRGSEARAGPPGGNEYPRIESGASRTQPYPKRDARVAGTESARA